MSEELSKDQLIKLVADIMNANGTEGEIDSWLDIFMQSVPHPSASDLIFHPDRVSGISLEKELTPEEVVNIALQYKPILL
jgi:hypothetical protein